MDVRHTVSICDSCGKNFSNVYTLNAHKRTVHDQKKPYKCTLCVLAFSTKYKLNRHLDGVHSDTRDKFCEICGNAFKTREMLIKHSRTHFKGPFNCEICGEIFKYKASYDHHFKIKHEIKELSNDQKTAVPKMKNYECQDCFKVYKNFKSLKNHEENHAKGDESSSKKTIKIPIVENLICYVCNKSFDKKQDFELHLTSHEEEEFRLEDMILDETSENEIDSFIEKTNVDQVRNESISIVDYNRIKQESPANYVEKQDIVTFFKDECESEVKNVEITYQTFDIKPAVKKVKKEPLEKIICDICGMLFLNKSHLRRHHARKHREKSDYKYECDVCAARFLLRYDLQRHMIKHNSNRDIECPKCSKQFKTKSSLDCHIKFIHNQDRSHLDKQHVCNICSRSYFHKRHLDYHMRKHTNDRRYVCDKCDKSFLYSDAVKWHQIRVHKEQAPYVCSICSRKFIHEKTYESHLKEHDTQTGSLAVQCPICKKKISEKRHLPRHIRTHSKKGFTCDYCSESFKERFQLTKHLQQCEDKHNREVEVIYETVME